MSVLIFENLIWTFELIWGSEYIIIQCNIWLKKILIVLQKAIFQVIEETTGLKDKKSNGHPDLMLTGIILRNVGFGAELGKTGSKDFKRSLCTNTHSLN